MSVIRLILIDKKTAVSGLVPSNSIGPLFSTVGENIGTISEFWKKSKTFDPDLEKHFKDYQDNPPIFESHGDGLIVIDYPRKRIESYQDFQPARRRGITFRHDGQKTLEESPIEFEIPENWEIIDHIFEEP
ncbi:MAG: hypothetical protein HQM08_10385 [Candidatus Riflebacteria bacterium]|nr:hypothetical protein [Candidatus Riflebacteria bacterium]